MQRRIKLVVAYLGTRFHGWQRQNRQRTVQGELERALTRITAGLERPVVGAGRTDAGVHAAGQTAHLDLPLSIPLAGLVKGLNGALPDEIRVRRAVAVADSFHARSKARAKHYVYRARWQLPALPWQGLRAARVAPVAHWDRLEQAARLLPGTRDMASFSVPDSSQPGGSRTLFELRLVRHANGLTVHVWGDGFLRYQVRRMVGALLEVGWGKRSLASLQDLLDRPQPGAPVLTTPARGLTLQQVYYRWRDPGRS